MTTIKRFEDIIAWQKARELVKLVYGVTGNREFAKDYSLKDQIRRAAISVMLNIAEGFARRTSKEFAHFLSNASGSAAEVKAALYAALDQGYIRGHVFNDLYEKADEVGRLVGGLSKYLKGAHDGKLETDN